MQEDQWFIIANPNSGSGTTEEEWGYINNILSKKGISFRSEFTQHPLHATEIVQTAIQEGYRKILVAGGDGTYNEVINGIFDQKAVDTQTITLAMLPLGTGNDWVRMMKIPLDWEEAINLLETGKTILQDVGLVKYTEGDQQKERYFVNVTGLGFDAYIAANYLQGKKNLGQYSYFTSILRGLIKYKNQSVEFTVNGQKREEKIFTLAVGIGQFFGAGMKITPNAKSDDGLFDITLIKDVSKLTVIGQLSNLYSGAFIKHPKVETLQCTEISISSKEKVYLQMDGELIGHTPANFAIIKHALRVLVP